MCNMNDVLIGIFLIRSFMSLEIKFVEIAQSNREKNYILLWKKIAVSIKQTEFQNNNKKIHNIAFKDEDADLKNFFVFRFKVK